MIDLGDDDRAAYQAAKDRAAFEAAKAATRKPVVVTTTGAPSVLGDMTADVKRSNDAEQGIRSRHRDDIQDYGGRNVNAGLAGKALKGATFGMAPKIGSALASLWDATRAKTAGLPFGETYSRAYNDNLNALNAADAQTGRENPRLSFVAEGAGSLANPANRLIGMIGGAPRTIAGRIAASTGQGATGGAVSGAGSAEWRGEHGLPNMLKGAGAGMVVGALAGGAVQGVVEAGKASRTVLRARPATGRTLIPGPSRREVADDKTLGVLDDAGVSVDRITGRAADSPLMLGELAGNAGQRAMRAVQTVGGKGAVAMDRSLQARHAGTLGRTAEALERGVGTGGRDAIQLADDVRAAQKATAKPNYDAAYAYGELKDPATVKAINDLFNLPDKAGNRWKRAFGIGKRVAAQDPDGAAVAAYPKSRTPSDRINWNKLEQTPADDLISEMERQYSQMSKAQEQAQYRHVEGQGSTDAADAMIVASTRRGPGPSMQAKALHRIDQAQGVLDKLNNELRRRGMPDEEINDLVAARMERAGIQEEGEGFGRVAGHYIRPTVRDIDYMKRGIDAMTQHAAKSGKGLAPAEAKFMRSRLEGIMKMVDDEVPAFGLARSAWKGDAEFLDALNAGKAFVNEDARVVRRTVGGYSASELEAYRVGAVDDILRRARSAPDAADLIKRVFGSVEKREALRELFPEPKAYRAFVRTLQQEGLAEQTNAFVRAGTKAAHKGEDAASLFGDTFGSTLLPSSIIGWNPLSIALRSGAKVRQLSDAISGKAMAQDVGANLRTRLDNPQAMNDVVERLRAAVGRQQVAGQRAGRTGRVVGGATALEATTPAERRRRTAASAAP